MTSPLHLRERNAAIYERRKQGLTLQAVGNEFGLSRDRVRQICFAEARRIERAQQTGNAPLLPVRVRNCLKYYLGIPDENPHEAARAIAKMPREEFRQIPYLGRKSLKALDEWLAFYGYTWSEAVGEYV